MKDFIGKVTSITFDSENEIESKSLRNFLHVFTEMGSTIGAILIIGFLILLSFYQEEVTVRTILYTFIPIYLFQLLMVEVLKILFKKPRPASHNHNNLFGKRITSGSFPSGHTSNIFTLAFLISNFYQLSIFLTVVVFTVAGIIAFSRILLGRHFTVDVVAGALCGLFFSVVGSMLLPHLLPFIL